MEFVIEAFGLLAEKLYPEPGYERSKCEVKLKIGVARIGEAKYKAWLHQSNKGYSLYL